MYMLITLILIILAVTITYRNMNIGIRVYELVTIDKNNGIYIVGVEEKKER